VATSAYELKHLARAIGRAIVDDYDLDMWVALSQATLDRRTDKMPVVEVGTQNGNAREEVTRRSTWSLRNNEPLLRPSLTRIVQRRFCHATPSTSCWSAHQT